ncbi:MAG TPA: SMC-Scp complex subunit ScpB [Ignavibacteria bacterium]
MENPDYRHIIEAILFGSDSELSVKQIKEILDTFRINLKPDAIEKQIAELNEEYISNGNAFEIIRIAGGYQYSTRKDFSSFVGKLYTESQRKKLSQSALETLAVIAYKQPVTRNEIEFVRGVNVDYIVNSLLERELINIIGRANSPGRPILYGTTKNFLRVLGLNSLEDLPKLREINEILKTEKIEGITEADIDLFNSLNTPEVEMQKNIPDSEITGQLSLLDTADLNQEDSEEDFKDDLSTENITELNSEGITIQEVEEMDTVINPEDEDFPETEEGTDIENDREQDKNK